MKFPTTLFLVCSLLSLPVAGHEDIRKELDAAIAFKRKGEQIPVDVRARCSKSFANYTVAQFNKHGVELNTQFPEPDRTDFYVNCVRAGIVRPKQQGGWIKRSGLRLVTMDNLVKQVQEAVAHNDQTLDSFRIYAYFLPAAKAGKTELAIQAYELLLVCDPFLAEQALLDSFDPQTGELWIESQYKKQQRDADARDARKLFLQALFPKGETKVEIEQCKSAPTAGVHVLGLTEKSIEGIEKDDVIVAVHGRLVQTYLQYCYCVGLDLEKPKMDLIVWRQDRFLQVGIDAPDRRLGVAMVTYDPPL